MRVRNYTNIKTREKRVYTFFDVTVSKEGLVVKTLYTMATLLLIFTIFGVATCFGFETNFYSPFRFMTNAKSTAIFYIIFVITPIGLGQWLNSYKVQNYKLVDYLKIIMIPKVPKNSDGKILKEKGYKINGFIDKLK